MFAWHIFGDRSSINPTVCGIFFYDPLQLMLIFYLSILGPPGHFIVIFFIQNISPFLIG